mmetsp:Transcript_60571/g.138454  ORF Transcript_60571/g.138454 Transcript_60571/m.138454 type:complete len:80 (-) Transcript_60571:55-294(-)
MVLTQMFGGMNMFVRGASENNSESSAMGHHSSIFTPWSGPPRVTKGESDARHAAINGSNGIGDILKRAMGNRKAMFART